MTPIQIKEQAVKVFTKNLNQKKNYFKDIEQKIDPICEADEGDEETL